MKARLLVRTKEFRDDGSIVEVVIWELPEPLPPSTHHYKYRLFHGTADDERVRYDNERGKGDHRHHGGQEETYAFSLSINCSTISNKTSSTGVVHEGHH